MANLEDFKKSVSEMETEELHQLLHKIRASRRAPPTKKSKKKGSELSAKEQTGTMNKDEIALLLKTLGVDV